MTSAQQVKIGAAPAEAEAAVRVKEEAWSQAIREGCSPSRDAGARKKIGTFLQENLANDYTNIDNLGKLRSKQEDYTNCVDGHYVVNYLTPPEMEIHIYGDCAVVVGKDEVHATFKGQNVCGKFIWTDTWVKSGDEWQCVAHHGSNLEPEFVVSERDKKA